MFCMSCFTFVIYLIRCMYNSRSGWSWINFLSHQFTCYFLEKKIHTEKNPNPKHNPKPNPKHNPNPYPNSRYNMGVRQQILC